MSFEPAAAGEPPAQRKEFAQCTLRRASPEELRALVKELFPDATHPFAEAFSKFIDEHPSETAVRGDMPDGIALLFYPRSNRGMWCLRATGTVHGVGVLGARDLKAVSELCNLAGLA